MVLVVVSNHIEKSEAWNQCRYNQYNQLMNSFSPTNHCDSQTVQKSDNFASVLCYRVLPIPCNREQSAKSIR